jgi:hypothetical protein
MISFLIEDIYVIHIDRVIFFCPEYLIQSRIGCLNQRAFLEYKEDPKDGYDDSVTKLVFVFFSAHHEAHFVILTNYLLFVVLCYYCHSSYFVQISLPNYIYHVGVLFAHKHVKELRRKYYINYSRCIGKIGVT